MQNQAKRTDANAARAADTETTEWDCEVPGLGIRTRVARRTWIVQWRVRGKTRKRTLGRVEDISCDAARRLARALLDAPADTGTAVGVRTSASISVFGEQYLEECKASWKPATLRANRHGLSSLIHPHLGQVKVGALSRDQVVAWMGSLTCAAGSVNRALAVLSGMMRHAELLGLRRPESNPCQGLRRHKSAFKAVYLDPVQWPRLGRALEAKAEAFPRQVGCIRFLAMTGCRRGEALGLRWEMIDGARVALPDAKSGPRAIWLGTPALRLLASFPRSNDYVFGLGQVPLGAVSLDRFWTRLRNEAGLPGVRMHDLRHSFASLAVGEGLDLKVVGKLLGHADLDTTQGYAHLDAPAVKAASQRVGEHLSIATGERRKPKGKPRRRVKPTAQSIYQTFATSRLSLQAFCEANTLDPATFRRDLIAWRATTHSGRANA